MIQTPGTDKPAELSNSDYHHNRHRHRHHRWYKRWWRTINFQGRAVKVILVIGLIAAAIAIGYLGSHSDSILPSRPKRMVMNEMVSPSVDLPLAVGRYESA